MAVEKQRLRWDILDAFAQARSRPAFRPPTTSTAAPTRAWATSRSTRKRLRWNTAKAFLRPTCYGRPNFEMWTRAQAAGCFCACRTAASAAPAPKSGPAMNDGGQRGSAALRGRRQLAAAPAAVGHRPGLLQQHGIPTLCDLPGVGANLQDHLQIRAVYKVQGAKTLNTMASSWGKAKIGLEYASSAAAP
jgi:choline dehydrogenase